jgi:pimeloyl-ACP methyl ester carboxylesterase
MVAFGLVHGAWHDAWCWDEVRRELEMRGHVGVAPDMPINQPGLGLADYAEVVGSALPADEGLILVGHSLGASVIPLVAAKRRVRRLVFVCPVLRQPGRTLAEQADEDADMSSWDLMTGRTLYDDQSSAWTDAHAAVAAFYQDCDPALAREATQHLRRQYWRYWDEPNPLTEWPEAELRAIVCREDRLCGLDWARREIPRRLGVTPVELAGGHSPFLSRPRELVDALLTDL